MKKCKCGSKNFNTICSTRVILELKNGVLTVVEEEKFVMSAKKNIKEKILKK